MKNALSKIAIEALPGIAKAMAVMRRFHGIIGGLGSDDASYIAFAKVLAIFF